jgi:hypothetical protein
MSSSSLRREPFLWFCHPGTAWDSRPFDGRPVMKAMSSTSMETGSSNHKNPPWRTAINCLMQLFTSFPLPKWGISTKFRIPVFSRPVAHFFGCSIGSPNGPVPRLSMYTCCANSGNLLVSDTSWSMYLSLSMQPSRVGVACTPSGMCGNTIEASGCLRGDRAMGCFPFLLTGALEVPTSGSLSSPRLWLPCDVFNLYFLLLCGPHHRLWSRPRQTLSAHCHHHLFCGLLRPSQVVVGFLWRLVRDPVHCRVSQYPSDHRRGLFFFLDQCGAHWFDLR